MVLLRTEVTEFGVKNGKDTQTIIVRAASKMGAIMTARVRSVSNIPARSQKVVEVKNLSNERFLDKWEVKISDVNKLENIGR